VLSDKEQNRLRSKPAYNGLCTLVVNASSCHCFALVLWLCTIHTTQGSRSPRNGSGGGGLVRSPLLRGRSYRLASSDVQTSNSVHETGGRVLDAVVSFVPMCVREHYKNGAQLRHHIPAQVRVQQLLVIVQ
jgi:hypothetical protein